MAGRIARESKTLEALVALYCRARHGTPLCPECRALLIYSIERIRGCRFGASKPTCLRCPVHCFAPGRREAIRRVMRFAGPRMAWRHPLLALLHLLDGRRRPG